MFKVTICYLERRARVKSRLEDEVVSELSKLHDDVVQI